ncbi:ABC transporter substrate-binding protein [Fulvimarina sp. 2208YS6-2-32]|uniref:ABC transporter substrate-binding protein n=1 Tax=Fulvimarina uroteuthidis TaxID=3098149 RepID=A0ABU5I3F5_9HYPH|nr:ABC transporter substrate-binding protein [Fulvimarina sp. 2208YS6-2-32]MDY8109882.1 ABC transporter substrate-binding protein [Fulvimarina sp. 2208YS6-2-32]
MRIFKSTFFASAMSLAAVAAASAQDVPAGYPADYAQTIEAAKAEGRVVIYTSTDAAQAQRLLDAFTGKYGIKVEYNDLGTNGAYNRAISEAAASQVGADIVWSAAMDLQMTLAADGYMEPYDSPEKANLPEWANYEDTLYATTIEPIGMIYNTGALSKDDVPQTRADLIAYFNDNRDELRGRVATFDPEKSGAGFLHHTNDAQSTDSFWDLAKAMGGVGVKTYSSSGSMRETVVSGENVLAINIIGSYALDWVKDSPNLGVAFGTDYTAGFSRLAGIMKDSPNPEAAKLFVDFMLSQEGQNALAAGSLPSVRDDVTEGLNLSTLNERVGGKLDPIDVDDHLLTYMQPQKRVEFFREWTAATTASN